MSDKRKVELKKLSGWCPIKFEELRTGMIFRLFESDGQPVEDHKGNTEFKCTSDAYRGPHGPNKEEVWIVKTEDEDD